MIERSGLAVLSVMLLAWAIPISGWAQLPAGAMPGTGMQRTMPPRPEELVGQRRGAGQEEGAASKAPDAAASKAPDSGTGRIITIGFNNGSAQLTPTATRRLDALGSQVDARSRIRVDGFAWGIGSRDAVRDLARRRADAVIGYLEALGIGRDRLSGNATQQDAPARGVRVTVLYARSDEARRTLSEEGATDSQ